MKLLKKWSITFLCICLCVIGATHCGKKQEEKSNIAQSNEDDSSDSDVDYDLTQMDSDMVYATVYQLMVDPDSYVGKTFRIDGTYYAGQDQNNGNYYHCCIIKDAMACCAQGLEFVWGDGSHIYPDEYPAEDSEIEVQGIFETYKEKNDDTLYCRLANADMRVLK